MANGSHPARWPAQKDLPFACQVGIPEAVTSCDVPPHLNQAEYFQWMRGRLRKTIFNQTLKSPDLILWFSEKVYDPSSSVHFSQCDFVADPLSGTCYLLFLSVENHVLYTGDHISRFWVSLSVGLQLIQVTCSAGCDRLLIIERDPLG